MLKKFLYISTVLCLFSVHEAYAGPNNSDSKLCVNATGQIERALAIPDGFLSAISRVETGRLNSSGKLEAWPWTINVEGRGYFYDSKIATINAIHEFQRLGKQSIDVGCMQVNIFHHPDAFSSMEMALDPYNNVRYAGKFLIDMRNQTGSWPRAAAAYHSMIESKGTPYLQHVLEQWAIPQDDKKNNNIMQDHKVTVPTSTLKPVAQTQTKKFRPFSILTPEQANSNRTKIQPDKVMTALNNGSLNTSNNVQTLKNIRNEEQQHPKPYKMFRPFKGYFRLNNPPAPHQRIKTTNNGKNLSSYRKETINEVAPMPMKETY